MRFSKLLSLMSVVCLAIAGLVGCASSEAGLKQATASQISGSSPEDFRIVDIRRTATTVKWVAYDERDNTRYNGSADDMVRNPSVSKDNTSGSAAEIFHKSMDQKQ